MKKPSLQLYVACEPKVVPLDMLTWPLIGLLSAPQLTANDKNEKLRVSYSLVPRLAVSGLGTRLGLASM